MKTVERIKKLRKENSLNQKDVADFLGMSLTGYAGYEQGKTRLPIEHLSSLSDYYNVTADYLLGKSDLKHSQTELEFYNDIKVKNLNQLVDEYNITLGDKAMSDDEMRILIKLMKGFLEDENWF